MSDTDNQENLSVEDILSSIKNILVDENGQPIEQENKAEPDAAEQSTDTPKEEDVFNLDDTMIVTEPLPVDNISTMLEETPAESDTPSTDNSLVSEADIQETLNMVENIDIDSLPAIDNLLEEEKETTVDEETIDASASIINNFAKVFAEKQQEKAQNKAEKPQESTPEITEKVQSDIEKIGIDKLVEETVIKQVKASIDAHFEKIATSIITNQTKEWLNDNLASIVEKTVAKEIERVIAKVGS